MFFSKVFFAVALGAISVLAIPHALHSAPQLERRASTATQLEPPLGGNSTRTTTGSNLATRGNLLSGQGTFYEGSSISLISPLINQKFQFIL
jgi:hypothetical protein